MDFDVRARVDRLIIFRLKTAQKWDKIAQFRAVFCFLVSLQQYNNNNFNAHMH